MARTSDARRRTIETAERLFRVQGYAATGLTQIIEESGAPKGSFYFHFPGGKRELATEVLADYRAKTSKGFRALAAACAGDADRFIHMLAEATSEGMRQSNWASGCAAQVFAQELAPADTEMSDALASLFEEWVGIVAEALGDTADPESARSKAVALVSALEGARTLARALQSSGPFEAVAAVFASTATSHARHD